MRIALAVLLGAIGFLLNKWNVSLLPQGPEFVFGGIAALLAFVWLGPAAGLLASLVSLSALWSLRGPATIVVVVYVLEAWSVSWLGRRMGSLVAASAIYWLSVGWILDAALYGGLFGLQFPFLMLLLVKQLLNGFVNAGVAEVSLWLMPPRIASAFGHTPRTETLQVYLFRRVLGIVLLPLFGLTFLYAEVFYARRVEAAQAQQLRTASDLRLRVEALALKQNDALMWLGRTVEMARLGGKGNEQESLSSFRRWHPEFTAAAIIDRQGVVVAAFPDSAGGQRLVGTSVAKHHFFVRARQAMRMSSVPQVVGPAETSGGRGRLTLVMAPPLLDGRGEFDGVAFGATDHRRMQDVLSGVTKGRGELLTLVDAEFKVMASLDPALPAGTSLRERLPVGTLSHVPTVLFTYLPKGDGSWASRFGMTERYAAFEAIPAFDFAVLVDLPIVALQEQMLGATFSVIGVLATTLLLSYLLAVVVSRQFSRPLTRVNVLSGEIAAGRFPGPAPLVDLARSGVQEIRGLGTNLLTMQESLMEYRTLSAARERESEERFSATFHQAAVGIAHLDLDLRWQRVNERLCAIVGAEPDRLPGTAITTMVHPDDRAATEGMFRDVLMGERETGRLEVRYLRPGGEDAVTQITASVVRERNGAPKYFILVMEDIADRKRLEAELLQAQKMESVGRLAGGVAHDFNNLLTAILGYGEMLAARLVGDKRALADLQEVREAGERASRLTRQLLAFARRQVIEPRAVDLNALVRNMENMLRRLIGEDVELESDLDGGLQSVRADPGQIEQVILNLAVNARDAMPEGGRLRLTTGMLRIEEGQRGPGALAAGRYVRLSVTDTGEGMSEEVRAHIFEPFFTTKRQGQGTGLGLATCYGIVKQSGGDIEATSEPGKGSTFSVYLPAVASASDEAVRGKAADTRGGHESVLLVEDEPAVARMARHALDAAGYSVEQAPDGEAALALFGDGRQPPDLLVTDVVMPRVGGAELAQRLRERFPNLKVLFTSGYSYDAIGRGGVLQADTAFLQKPFTPAALARAVRDVLDGRSQAPSGETPDIPAD